MKLRDAVCVITGGSKGLGRHLARTCQARGAKVIIGAHESGALQETIEELQAPGLRCDVTERHEVEALAEDAISRYGQIDVWINNAGVWMPYAPVADIDFARARALMEVNYFGLAHGTVEALKRMRANKGVSAIVNVISVRGLEGKALAAGYSASKFAAEGFTQAVRAEMKDSNIHIIGVHPYRMKTELFGDNKHADYKASMDPAEVAKIIIDNLEQATPAHHVEIWSHTDVRTRA